MTFPCDNFDCPHLIDVYYNPSGVYVKCKRITHGMAWNVEYLFALLRDEEVHYGHIRFNNDRASLLECPHYNKLKLIAKMENI